MRTEWFDGQYYEAVKSACAQAISRTPIAADCEPDRVRGAEICVALAHIMGIIAAMAERPLDGDGRAWADDLVTEFVGSFLAAKQSIDEVDRAAA